MMTTAFRRRKLAVVSTAMTHQSQDNPSRLTAREADAGTRLDRFLAVNLAELSRSRLKRLIEAGHVRAGAVTITEPSYRVKPGEHFDLTVPPPEAAAPVGQPIPLQVVYEDADVIVIDKPAGMVVHPAPGNPDRTLVNALIAHCGASLSGIGGVRRPGIVHRIDKDTSGLLVAAKTDAAHAGLADQFARHTIERVYLALVWGRPAASAGAIDDNIGRDRHNRKKFAVVRSGGKTAMTRYKVVQGLGDAASLLAVRLTTGRTHQIRVHLSYLGHPVVGDPMYGRARRDRLRGLPPATAAAFNGFGRQALHAAVLGFDHPISGASLRFERPLPDDMAVLIAALGPRGGGKDGLILD